MQTVIEELPLLLQGVAVTLQISVVVILAGSLLGLFGGLVTFGFIGLFLGPCLLALGYTLIREWIGMEKERRNRKLAADSEE